MSHYTDEEVNAFWADVEYVESESLEKGWYGDNVLSDLIEERERRKIEGWDEYHLGAGVTDGEPDF